MVTYAIEHFSEFWREAGHLLQEHWDEVALDHEEIPLDPDVAEYLRLQEFGMLQVLVARCAGEMVGYHLSIIRPHLHYKSSLHAFTDVYFVAPAHRLGMTGYRLFREAERAWKRRGVKKAMTGTKLKNSNVTNKSLDVSVLFERLGWRETERTWTKCLGT